MTTYRAYLEKGGGLCMAHVLDLPGCFVRAASRDEALRVLPSAVAEYHAWLRRHDEPAPPPEAPVDFEVPEEVSGTGPFDPGDAAALFEPERVPVTPEEIEHHLRLMGHSRKDLLALIADLPDEILDWKPGPDVFDIRRVLRHVGNAEEWYVSRLVDPAKMRPSRDGDEEMPITDFLTMQRNAAVERLRALTEEERSRVWHPAQWTDHPYEPWSARKALRRFLEHEREHTGQAREILAACGGCRAVRDR